MLMPSRRAMKFCWCLRSPAALCRISLLCCHPEQSEGSAVLGGRTSSPSNVRKQTMATRKVKIGLLGCGTVGRGLVELIGRNDSLIRQRTGLELGITKILVRDLDKERPGVDCALLTNQPEKVLN